MSKLIGAIVAALLLQPATNPERGKFAKYKVIEAYEIRPGILMMPRYSANGQVCEIGIEKLHYSPEEIRLDSSLSRKEINEIFDELVPSAERGPQPTNALEKIIGGFISGRSMVTAEEYQNVSIYIYGETSGDLSDKSKTPATLEEVAATLKWKDRICQ